MEEITGESAAEQTHNEKYDWLKIIPIVFSAFALIISTGGLLYTVRTYSVTHRPYLGIVDGNYQLLENPPRAIIWKFIIKNVGTQPAVLKIEQNKTTITTPSGVMTLPTLGDIGETVSYVMPGQTVHLLGQYSEVNNPTRMDEIINGSAVLDTYINLSYFSEGAFGTKNYNYSTQFRFHSVRGVEPGFSTVKAEGN